MKSGELLTSTENSIINLSVIRTAHRILAINNIKDLRNAKVDKAKGDDGLAAYKVNELKDEIIGDKRIITYSDEVINQMEIISKAFASTYDGLRLKQNISKGGIDNMRANYLKKFIITGYIFYNVRVQLFCTELAMVVKRIEFLTTIVSKARLMIERGGKSDVLYNLVLNLIIVAMPIKIKTKDWKQGEQNFIIPLFSTIGLKIEDGGINFPLNDAMFIVPNSAIMTALRLKEELLYGKRFKNIIKRYRYWYDNTTDSQFSDRVVDLIISGKYDYTTRGNYDLQPKLNLNAFNSTLSEERLTKSNLAYSKLNKKGHNISKMLRYTTRLYRYFAISLKGSNLNATNNIVKLEYVTETKNILQKLTGRAADNLVDGLLDSIEIKILEQTFEPSKLPNVAIGSGYLYKSVLQILGYATANKISPLNLVALQKILNRDVKGPKDIRAEVLLKKFLDPYYLLSRDNFILLLETIGFSSAIADDLLGELKGKAIYYAMVEEASYSYMSETLILSDLSEGNLQKFIDVEVTHNILKSFFLGIGLFYLIEKIKLKDYRRIQITYNRDAVSEILKNYGYRA